MDTLYETTEILFKINPETTDCYVKLNRVSGDPVAGMVGWHKHAFPASMSILEILESDEFLNNLTWKREVPY